MPAYPVRNLGILSPRQVVVHQQPVTLLEPTRLWANQAPTEQTQNRIQEDLSLSNGVLVDSNDGP